MIVREKLTMSLVFPSSKSCHVQPPAMEIDAECYKEVDRCSEPWRQRHRSAPVVSKSPTSSPENFGLEVGTLPSPRAMRRSDTTISWQNIRWWFGSWNPRSPNPIYQPNTGRQWLVTGRCKIKARIPGLKTIHQQFQARRCQMQNLRASKSW